MIPPPSAAAIEDTAIAWLTERDDGFSPVREREYAEWLRADPRHAAAVARLEQTLGLLGELPEFRDELNTDFARTAGAVSAAPEEGPASSRRSYWLALGGVAAAVAFAALVGWRMFADPVGTFYAAPAASSARTSLEDGSTIELNSQSAVRVQFSKAERHVNLESGEAHFLVAPDALRPFVVSAGSLLVRAVGTAFNVRLSSDGGVEVIVTEGKVRVSQDQPKATQPANAQFVAAGERLVLPKASVSPVVEKIDPGLMMSALSWQERLVEFADAPLAEIVARFNARNRVQLVLGDAELAQRRIGGTFALDEAEAFVRLLERNGAIVAERRGESEILLRSAR